MDVQASAKHSSAIVAGICSLFRIFARQWLKPVALQKCSSLFWARGWAELALRRLSFFLKPWTIIGQH